MHHADFLFEIWVVRVHIFVFGPRPAPRPARPPLLSAWTTGPARPTIAAAAHRQPVAVARKGLSLQRFGPKSLAVSHEDEEGGTFFRCAFVLLPALLGC